MLPFLLCNIGFFQVTYFILNVSILISTFLQENKAFMRGSKASPTPPQKKKKVCLFSQAYLFTGFLCSGFIFFMSSPCFLVWALLAKIFRSQSFCFGTPTQFRQRWHSYNIRTNIPDPVVQSSGNSHKKALTTEQGYRVRDVQWEPSHPDASNLQRNLHLIIVLCKIKKKISADSSSS